jgi:hypothetical protein
MAHIPKTRLLVASPMDQEFIYLYEAQITSDFLGMLDNPKTATIQTNFPTIERRQISFRPFETFEERIWAELLHFPPDVSVIPDDTCPSFINQNGKRPHEQEDDEMCKRG